MKKIAVLPAALVVVALLGACASSDGFIDKKTNNCAPGQPIDIQAGLEAPGNAMDRTDDRLTMLVEVANNSDEDITVKYVRVDPATMDRDASYEIDNAYQEFGQLIAEADDFRFEIPMRGHKRFTDRRTTLTSAIDLAVTVGLESGQSYRCSFRVPVPQY